MSRRALDGTRKFLSSLELTQRRGSTLIWLVKHRGLWTIDRINQRNRITNVGGYAGRASSSGLATISSKYCDLHSLAQIQLAPLNRWLFFTNLYCEHIRPMSTNNRDDGLSQEEKELREKYQPREIRFKTPYGHLACLEWGQSDAPNKILCVHGWLDNAGSFERLIPFILDHKDNHKNYHVVAMDMPGVGFSSHRPVSTDYTTFSNVIEMRRVATQLGWNNNLTLLSHSLGAHLSFIYSCIYPRDVESFISIDVERPITFQATNWNVAIANSIENHFRCEYHHQTDPNSTAVVPVYQEAQALKRLMEAHGFSLTRESAKVMMKRGARRSDHGYTFNRDVRHRYMSAEFRPDDDLMMKYLDRTFSPNLFVIRSTKSPFRRPEQARIKYYEIFERNCPIFRDKIIEGTHHLHMNTPDIVAAEINKFLEEVQMAKQNEASKNCDGNGADKSPPIMKPNL